MDPKQKQFSIWYVFIALWALMLIQIFVTPFFFLKPMEIPYSEFKAAVAAGKVEEISVGSAMIHGQMKPDSSSAAKEGGALTRFGSKIQTCSGTCRRIRSRSPA